MLIKHGSFWLIQTSCFVQKNLCRQTSLVSRKVSLEIEPTTSGLACGTCYHLAALLLAYSKVEFVKTDELWYFIQTTDYRSNFAKTILFENCFCFSKINFSISVESPRIFQCLISIPADHWVRRIDGDLPRRFFVSFTQLVISKTGRFWTIRKSAAQWRRNRARGYKKSILRANLLYFPIVKM